MVGEHTLLHYNKTTQQFLVKLIIVSRWLISNQDAVLIAITITLVHVGNGVLCMARAVECPSIHGVRYLMIYSNKP